ncbi:hypothetical protein ACFL2T_05460 [Elusimicrobiota bacterium]
MIHPLFKRYIGIDYSGAEAPVSRLKGLQVFEATSNGDPTRVDTTAGDGNPAKHTRWNWSRKEIAHWLADQLASEGPIIVGIDHGFSFPDSYFKRYGLNDWDVFLDDFVRYWPTHEDHTYIEAIREQNPPRTGPNSELRLSERWTSSTQSVFKLDGQGSVGKATHAGIPWLRFLRQHSNLRRKIHFWPFDGFDVPVGKSVIAEVWPSIFRRRYPRDERTQDEHDAYSVARWLQETNANGFLDRYFDPPLMPKERQIVSREGWLFGIL